MQAAKLPGYVSPTERPEIAFIPNLLTEFLDVLEAVLEEVSAGGYSALGGGMGGGMCCTGLGWAGEGSAVPESGLWVEVGCFCWRWVLCAGLAEACDEQCHTWLSQMWWWCYVVSGHKLSHYQTFPTCRPFPCMQPPAPAGDAMTVHGALVLHKGPMSYCEHFLALLVDLLSQLPTRR